MSIRIEATPIDGLVTFETSRIGDHRGNLTRLFCARELEKVLGERVIVQVNRSVTSQRGAVRGMHFQLPPFAEMKVVRCLRGRVFDVAVDLRADSASFRRWFGVELSAEQDNAIVIPEGFAHGFQVLEPDSELLYLHTAYYEPGAEGGIRHDDPLVEIEWPEPATDLSNRDANHPLLTHDYSGITL